MRILLFHKPKGVIVSKRDEHKRKTVYDLLPAWVTQENWIPVGRLDQETRGLLLFVQDGKLMDFLSAPGNFSKEYEALVRGHVTEEQVKLLIRGIETAIGVLRCEEIRNLRYIGPKTQLTIVLKEGKNRQIRRMFGALKDPLRKTPLKVMELKRVRFGPVTLGIPSGHWRFLNDEEIEALS